MELLNNDDRPDIPMIYNIWSLSLRSNLTSLPLNVWELRRRKVKIEIFIKKN